MVVVLAVHLFAEVKVRSDGVFDKLRQQISREQEHHRNKQTFTGMLAFFVPELDDLWQYLNDGHGQHKTGTESEQIFQKVFEPPVDV